MNGVFPITRNCFKLTRAIAESLKREKKLKAVWNLECGEECYKRKQMETNFSNAPKKFHESLKHLGV